MKFLIKLLSRLPFNCQRLMAIQSNEYCATVEQRVFGVFPAVQPLPVHSGGPLIRNYGKKQTKMLTSSAS